MSDQPGQDDVVSLLLRQHERIRGLFDEVEHGEGQTRQERFEDLRRFLAVHETAEELVVHPQAGNSEAGSAVVDARRDEERAAKEILADLDAMVVTDPSFDAKFASLRVAVLAHAESEEQEEFPLLRAQADEQALRSMADAVRAAEAVAPTHPHPGVESGTANLAAGPLASLVDRTRDVVRSAMGQSRSG